MAASEQAGNQSLSSRRGIGERSNLSGTKEFYRGLEAFEHAMELNPSHPDYRQLVGMAKIILGRSEEALASQNEAIRLSPRDLHIADYYLCVGVAYWELERYPEALNWFERSKPLNLRIEATKFFLAALKV